MTVHLVTKAQNERVDIGTDCFGICGQIAVVLSGGDCGEADAIWVNLHERHGTVLGRGTREGSLEWLQP
jgi:hypothetical protein